LLTEFGLGLDAVQTTNKLTSVYVVLLVDTIKTNLMLLY